MESLSAAGTLVELSSLDEESRVIAAIDRAEVEALLASGSTPRLSFEVAIDGEPEPQLLTVAISDADLRALLGVTADPHIALAIDGEALADLLDGSDAGSDVEAHGMRTALAIAVAAATAAIAAPTAVGATPQALGTAAKQQGVGAAATRQVSSQIVHSALARSASKSSVARSSALTFRKLRILRARASR